MQAKLQLFQDYRALFEIFFCSRSKKACFFQVERLLKKFYDAAMHDKSLYSGEDIRKLDTVANMVAKIDIDALKLQKKNQEQMILKIGKKLTTASLNSRVTGAKKNSVLRLVHF